MRIVVREWYKEGVAVLEGVVKKRGVDYRKNGAAVHQKWGLGTLLPGAAWSAMKFPWRVRVRAAESTCLCL